MIRRLASSIALVLAVSACHADAIQEWVKLKAQIPRGYQCRKTPTPLVIDGRMDEAAWAEAPWTEEFLDIQGASLPKPKYPTRAKMLWDDTYFYMAAKLVEPHIWGTITQRDAVIFQDNDFEVFIDPDGDNHQYYEFEMNVLNTGWDLRLVKAYKDGGPALNEWDIAGLKTAVHIEGTLNNPKDTDQAWYVEIAMPWKALAEFSTAASPPKPGDRWRLGFSRVEWQIDTSSGKYQKVPKTPEDNWVWSPTGIIDMHRPERWGIVEFATASARPKAIRPNADDVARDQLMEVYYLQRQFHGTHKKFASSYKELIPLAQAAGLSIQSKREPRIELTPDGYTASVSAGFTRSRRWHVRQDAKLWRD